ncbi:hypothetical protein GGP85_003040 [Salinibacter ruber]|nr:hypothetical protein [Salinibacter ruber]
MRGLERESRQSVELRRRIHADSAYLVFSGNSAFRALTSVVCCPQSNFSGALRLLSK